MVCDAGRVSRRARPAGRVITVAILAVLVVTTAAAALVSVLEDAGDPARPGLAVGLVANALGGGVAELDEVRRLDVRWVREEVRWAEVEPTRGRRTWARTDRIFAAAAQRGIRVLPLVLETPSWAGRQRLGLPRDPTAFARFAALVAARYGPGGRFWQLRSRLDDGLAPRRIELWNEPYLEFFSRGGTDPQRYAQMVAASVEAVRGANPDVQVLMAAETTYDRPDGTVGDWTADVLAARPDLAGSVGGVAVHPYTPRSPTATGGPRRTRFTRMDEILATLRRHGATTPRLWITEIGWTTCEEGPDCVSESRQVQYTKQALDVVSTRYRDIVEGVFFYHLRDFAPAGRGTSQQHYGLLRADGSQKPAARAVRRAARAAAAG